MAQLIEDLAIACVVVLGEQRLEHAMGVRCMRARRTVGMFDPVQQAEGLRQQQRADQHASQRSAQGLGNEAAMHACGVGPAV